MRAGIWCQSVAKETSRVPGHNSLWGALVKTNWYLDCASSVSLEVLQVWTEKFLSSCKHWNWGKCFDSCSDAGSPSNRLQWGEGRAIWLREGQGWMAGSGCPGLTNSVSWPKCGGPCSTLNLEVNYYCIYHSHKTKFKPHLASQFRRNLMKCEH